MWNRVLLGLSRTPAHGDARPYSNPPGSVSRNRRVTPGTVERISLFASRLSLENWFCRKTLDASCESQAQNGFLAISTQNREEPHFSKRPQVKFVTVPAARSGSACYL